MKGQGEIIAFILLLLIGLLLFAAATMWSRGIFQENVDFSNMEVAEKFMKDLDDSISSVIKFGGMKELDFVSEGTIEILNSNTIEVRIPSSLSLQESWVNISENGSYIREMYDGEDIILQLVYPESDYRVNFFTEDLSLAQPEYIKIEKDSTYIGAVSVIKIKISFV